MVPGAEGSWIARALRAEGFVVHVREVPSEDALVLRVVERSVPGALEALRRLRGEDAARLVLVGWEAAPERELEALRADVFYTRPVPLPRLRRWVRTLPQRPSLAPPTKGPLSSTPPAPESALPPLVSMPVRGPLSSTPPEPASALPPPATLVTGKDETKAPAAPSTAAPDVSQGGRYPTVVLPEGAARHATSEGPTIPTGSDDAAGSMEAARLGGGSAEAEVDPPTGAAPALSPGIERLIRDADRRLFPEEAPLDLRFATGSEGPEELVPDDLLDPAEADGLVGLEPEPADGLSVVEDAPAAPPSDVVPAHPAASRVLPAGPASLAPPPGEGGENLPSTAPPPPPKPVIPRREGSVSAAGVLPLFFELAAAERPTSLSLALPGGVRLRLVARGEALLGFEAPLASRATDALRAQGALAITPEDEPAARELLRRAVAEGDLDAYACDAALRRAAEALLTDAVAAPEAGLDVGQCFNLTDASIY